MFTIDSTITDIKIREKNLIKAFFSMNNHQVATPEMMLEEARSYILFFREGDGKISSYIALHLLTTGRKMFYAHSTNTFPESEMESVSQEALEFVEGLGALIDEADFSKSSSEDKRSWIDKQDIFSQKTGEVKAADQQPAEVAPEPAPVAEAQEAPTVQPPQQTYTTPAPQTPQPAQPAYYAPQTQQTPPAAYPPQSQPIILPPPQQQPVAQAPQQNHNIPPAPQPTQQPTPPAYYAQQPQQVPHAPVQQQQQVPSAAPPQVPQNGYAPQRPQAPYPPQPTERPGQEVVFNPEVEVQEESLEKSGQTYQSQQNPEAQRTVPGAGRKPGARPAGARSVAGAVPAKQKQKQNIMQTAIEAGIVKPPMTSLKRESQAAAGVVSRDRESLARLLTSF